MARSFRIQSTVHGHHIYKKVLSLRVRKELPVCCESDNDHESYAVAVFKDDTIVCHVLLEISRVCWFVLQKNSREMTCQVDGNGRKSALEGKGLVVPCVYVFRGKPKACQADKCLRQARSAIVT